MGSGPDVLIEALNRVAADPTAWDALIDVLPAESEPDAEPLGGLAVDHARAAAAVRRLPDEGVDGPTSPAIGWLLLSSKGRVLADNGAGLQALSGLAEVGAAQRLRWRRQSNELLAAAAIRRALATGAQIALRLERGRGASPVYGLASPPTLWPALLRGLGASDLAGAACLMFPSADQENRLSSLLRGSFGLTDAEAGLAQRLSDGQTLLEIAAELQVSPHTVRNHLRAVFDKMGVKRQGDLIRALSQLASLGPVLSPSDASADPLVDAPPLRLIRLSDGRRLSYRDYGDPRGRCLVSLHEGLGSSLPPPGAEFLARRLGLRVLAVDRPGFGLSDPRPDYRFETVSQDLAEILTRLAVRDIAVLGIATGAIHALHLAQTMGGRVRLALLATPHAPVRRPPADNAFQALRRRLEAQPLVAEALFAIVRARRSPRLARRMLERAAAASPGDQTMLSANPWFANYISACVGEALAVSTRGPVDELAAFRAAFGAPFPVLAAPVEAWCGAEDIIAPAGLFKSWVGTAATVRPIEGAGYLMAGARWSDLVTRVRTAWD